MKVKKRGKQTNSVKFAEEARRKDEIRRYGKIVSLRPSKIMESKKSYKRKKYKYGYED